MAFSCAAWFCCIMANIAAIAGSMLGMTIGGMSTLGELATNFKPLGDLATNFKPLGDFETTFDHTDEHYL